VRHRGIETPKRWLPITSKPSKAPFISKALILSSDTQLVLPASTIINDMGLVTEIWDHKAADNGRRLRQPTIRLIVIDDSEANQTERSWLLAQIRRWAPDARLLYVAAEHSLESESQARRSGANYYMAKPVDGTLLTRVLESFIRSIR
jgi:DNA-binding NtrC family response regulator